MNDEWMLKFMGKVGQCEANGLKRLGLIEAIDAISSSDWSGRTGWRRSASMHRVRSVDWRRGVEEGTPARWESIEERKNANAEISRTRCVGLKSV